MRRLSALALFAALVVIGALALLNSEAISILSINNL